MQSTKFSRGRRTRATSAVKTLVVVALTFSAVSVTHAGDLPSGEKIMDTYIEKSGGIAAYKAVKNRTTKLSMENMGQKMTITLFQAPPNKMAQIVESEMMGKMRQGFDGTTAWMMSDMTGPMIMAGPQADMIKKQADFDQDYNWRDSYEKAECQELTDFDGQPCYKVQLTSKGGETETRYYSKETGLLAGVEQNQMGMSATMKLKDYKKVGDIMYPHTMVQEMGGMGSSTITFESITVNTDMPDETFMPAEIAAKVKAESGSGDKHDHDHDHNHKHDHNHNH